MIKNKGFTLIELLVVVAVITMISSFAMALWSANRAKARDAVREEAMKEIQKAATLYATNNQFYPTCPITEVIKKDNTDCLSTALTGEGFMNVVLPDPLGGDTGNGTGCPPADGDFIYCYQSTDNGYGYILEYALETNTILEKTAGLQTITVEP